MRLERSACFALPEALRQDLARLEKEMKEKSTTKKRPRE